MTLPTISEEDVRNLIPGVTEITQCGQGGQKVVFRVAVGDRVFALKFALLPSTYEPDDADVDESLLRAKRETEIMNECKSPYIVKPGPIDLGTASIGAQKVLYFSEEFIDGHSLSEILRTNGPLGVGSLQQLGLQVCSAIDELWSLGKIHRDVKPGNIMRRDERDEFVLLDAGLAFDIAGESISAGMLVGTMAYFSPEQFEYTNRRVMDFRSDMFSLGVTLYEVATGIHPFLSPTKSISHLYTRITRHVPPPPSSVNPAIPPALDTVILRMMGKSPHLRYRRMSQLQEALASI
ncbi:MAG TPA: serine/threonine-protein kinase [Terracidiphilus sp.]|nr:serine/threonine-protein kinase [Terracidiphilus sp.]